MFRKLALALAASAALGAAALAPTAASAHGWHGGGWHGGGWHGGGWGHHHRGFGFSPVIVVGGGPASDGCLVTRRIRTPYGVRYRTVNVCY